MLDVLDFHYKHKEGDPLINGAMRNRLAAVILKKLSRDDAGQFVTSFNSKPKSIKGSYPNFFKTSECKNNDLMFYNSFVKVSNLRLGRLMTSYPSYGVLKRLEQILEHESNVNMDGVKELLALV